MSLTGLFNDVSIDFAGLRSTSEDENKYALIAVEHWKGWPVARETKDDTAATVMKFTKEEVLYHFGPPTVVVSDNGTYFTSKKLNKIMDAMRLRGRTSFSSRQ